MCSPTAQDDGWFSTASTTPSASLATPITSTTRTGEGEPLHGPLKPQAAQKGPFGRRGAALLGLVLLTPFPLLSFPPPRLLRPRQRTAPRQSVARGGGAPGRVSGPSPRPSEPFRRAMATLGVEAVRAALLPGSAPASSARDRKGLGGRCSHKARAWERNAAQGGGTRGGGRWPLGCSGPKQLRAFQVRASFLS